jgi:hypothetical protein
MDRTANSAERSCIELSDAELEAVSAAASGDYFLKIQGVDGESTDDKHRPEIR